MESSGQRGNNASPTGRGPQLIHSRSRSVVGGVQPSPKTSTQPAVIVGAMALCLFAPELANLHQDPDIAWKIYLALKEASNALFCSCLAWVLSGKMRALSAGFAVVFLTQAIHEAMGANEFQGQQFEYPAECVFLLLCYLLARRSNEIHE